ERTVYMAAARNRYLNRLKEFRRNNHVDYVIILDLDLKGGFSYDGILNSLCWIHGGKFDVMASNGILYRKQEEEIQRIHYDTWAYRPLDRWNHSFSDEFNLLSWNRGESPFEVNSAFGGVTIYRNSCILDDDTYLPGDCDHV